MTPLKQRLLSKLAYNDEAAYSLGKQFVDTLPNIYNTNAEKAVTIADFSMGIKMNSERLAPILNALLEGVDALERIKPILHGNDIAGKALSKLERLAEGEE